MNAKNEFVKSAAGKAAEYSLEKAKGASGWQKVLWCVATAVTAAVAWLCGNASQQQPDVQVEEPAICVPEPM